MSREAVRVSPDESLVEAARKMRDHSVSSVLVVDESGALVGILTERDLVHKMVAESKECAGITVKACMTPNPVTADSRDRVWEGARLMAEHRIHHLPVVRDGEPVGVVSRDDLSGMESEPRTTHDVIRGIEESSRERTVEIPATVGAADLAEIIPAWY
jgi:CBS domain-containing protein